ncbi:50S ribosomal protein L25 [Candidatus Poribacteria bacterium]|nr:50S ribosomal protein L25 [Candidatus Poribacteria bacterium]
MEQIELVVQKRESSGKGAVRKMRNVGQIPGILYGKNNNLNIVINKVDFSRIIATHKSDHAILSIKIKDTNDSTIDTKSVIVKEIQRNPITENIIHVDFQHIALDQKLRTRVPVVLTGKPEGVKEGGILEHLMHEIEIECLPLDIPEHITVDVSRLKLGEPYHIKDIPAIDKIKIVSSGDKPFAVVSTVRKEDEVVKKEETAAAATTAAQPEIVNKKGKAETAEAGAETAGAGKPAAKPAAKPAGK